MSKILFCDADGVINNRKTSNIDGWPIDQYAAFLVGRIVIETDCDVVLSSSWRYSEEGKEIFRKKVVPFIDTTPDYASSMSRGEEIKAWLDRHPEVEGFAILDDDADMLKWQVPNFFKTSFEWGLTDEISKAIIAHLNKTLDK